MGVSPAGGCPRLTEELQMSNVKFYYLKDRNGKIEMYANGTYISTFNNFDEIMVLILALDD